MRYQRLMKRFCNGCIVLAFLSIMMGVHVVTTHSLGYAETQPSATQSSGTPTSNSQPSNTSAANTQASGAPALATSSPAGSTNTSATATNPSDTDKPVELTDEQMKQNYFLNLVLRYKALDFHHSQSGSFSTIVKPDSDLGTFDDSWHNREAGAVFEEADETLHAFRHVKFNFFDKTLNKKADIHELKLKPVAGIRRVFFGFDPDHEYQISIDGTTVPPANALSFSLNHANYSAPVLSELSFKMNKTYDKFPPIILDDSYSLSDSYKPYVGRFYHTDLYMEPLEIIYANSVEDAKGALTIEKHPTLADKHTFKYDNSKIFKRVRIKDNTIPFPTEQPIRAGYKFLGWGYNLLFPKKADGTPDDDQNAYTIHNVLECTRQGNLTPDQENKCYSDYTNWAAETMRFDARHMRPAYQWSIIRDGVINKYGMQKDFLHAESPVFIVFAVWKKIPAHTVTFDPQGGILHGNPTVTVEDSALLPKPQDPTKQNYDFLGWYLDNTLWDFDSQTVTGDLTLKAKWKEKKKAPEPAPIPTPPAPAPTPEPDVTPKPQPRPPVPLTPPAVDPNKSADPVPVPTPSVPLTPSPAVPPVSPTEAALNPSPAKQQIKTALPRTDDVPALPALVLTTCALIASLCVMRHARLYH